MTLLQTIKQKLQTTSQKKLLKQMGYDSLKTGQKTLQSLLDADDIYQWIKTGHFDFKYTSKAFVKTLCKVQEVSEIDYVLVLDAYEQRAQKINHESYSFIYVNTDFVRTSESVMVLAILEGKRRVWLDKEVLFDMSKDEIIFHVSKLIQEHYQAVKGTLTLWGEIKNYVLHYKDEESVIFDVDGNVLLNKSPIRESKAVVKLNKKIIFGAK